MEKLSNLSRNEVTRRRQEFSDPHHIILTHDNASLFLRSWQPEEKSETAILILHGITAHSRPYEIMARPLNEAGYNVYGLDLRGHGLSSGNRGDYKSEQVLIDDLEATLQYIRNTLNHSKIVILGHSLGVMTCLKVLYHNIGEINGVALFSAAESVKEGVRPEPSIWEKIKIMVSSIIRPSTPVISYYREGMQGLDDPLFNFQYTLRFFQIFDSDTINLPLEFEYPLYMAIGTEDELFSIEGAQELFDKLISPDKEFNILENSKHAEFSENAFDDFVTWIKERY